jgi:flagellar basal-body rod protein FlgG
VQRASGEQAFTRAGNFRMDAIGRLVTQHGELVEPGITIPPDATDLTIKSDGTVTATLPSRTDPVELGQIELHTFVNPAGLSAIGSNLFSQTAASGDPTRARPGQDGSGTVAQGMLEGANVKAAEEMIDMISTQRAYELNSKVIQTADQMLQRLTNIR